MHLKENLPEEIRIYGHFKKRTHHSQELYDDDGGARDRRRLSQTGNERVCVCVCEHLQQVLGSPSGLLALGWHARRVCVRSVEHRRGSF